MKKLEILVMDHLKDYVLHHMMIAFEIIIAVLVIVYVIPNDLLVMADWEQKFFISLLLIEKFH